MDNILTNTLLPDVSGQLLGALAEGARPAGIHVGIGEDGSFLYSESEPAAASASEVTAAGD